MCCAVLCRPPLGPPCFATQVELREKATEQDARDVVELYKASLVDQCLDELGALDFTRTVCCVAW